MQITRNLILSLLAVLVFYSCDLNKDKPVFPEEDVKAPEIVFNTPAQVDSPAYGSNVYHNMDSLNINIDFSDNVELDRYQIDIFYRGDLYYLKTASDSMVNTTIGLLSGREKNIIFMTDVEFDPYAGPYEIKATVWDKAGHVTVRSTFINVINNNDPVLPMASITYPVANDTFSIGAYMPVNFTCSDNVGIFDVYLRVRNRYNHEMITDGEYRFYPFSGNMGNHTFYIPSCTPGNYDVELYVTDVNHNLTRVSVPVYITTY